MPGIDLVAGGGKIADHQFILREPGLDQRFEVVIKLQPVGQHVAEDGDVIAFLKR